MKRNRNEKAEPMKTKISKEEDNDVKDVDKGRAG